MRQIFIDIYSDNELIHSSDHESDQAPETVIEYLTHNSSGMVYEGRSVKSVMINKTQQFIEVKLLTDTDIEYFLTEIHPNFPHSAQPENLDLTLAGDLTFIKFPEELSASEIEAINDILNTETSGEFITIDEVSSYEFGASGFGENFFASVSSTYATRILDKLYNLFKKKTLKKGVNQFLFSP